MTVGDRIVFGPTRTGSLVGWIADPNGADVNTRMLMTRTRDGSLVGWPLAGFAPAVDKRCLLGRTDTGDLVTWALTRSTPACDTELLDWASRSPVDHAFAGGVTTHGAESNAGATWVDTGSPQGMYDAAVVTVAITRAFIIRRFNVTATVTVAGKAQESRGLGSIFFGIGGNIPLSVFVAGNAPGSPGPFYATNLYSEIVLPNGTRDTMFGYPYDLGTWQLRITDEAGAWTRHAFYDEIEVGSGGTTVWTWDILLTEFDQ